MSRLWQRRLKDKVSCDNKAAKCNGGNDLTGVRNFLWSKRSRKQNREKSGIAKDSKGQLMPALNEA